MSLELHPHFQISGSAEQRGVQYGELASSYICKNIEFYKKMFASYGISWEKAKSVALQYIPHIQNYLPQALSEMRGIAKGSNKSFEDILTLNCRSEIIFAMPNGCSSIGALPERTENAHTYLGQTWDWLKEANETTIILEIHPDQGPSLLFCAEAGIIGGKGLNSSGIGVCLNALSIGEGTLGVPLHIMYRAILSQTTISNALDCVAHPQRAGCGNFAIGSGEGFLMNVEFTPYNFDVLMPTQSLMCHTNHYLSPLFQGQDSFKRDLCDTFVRLNRLQRLAMDSSYPLNKEKLKVFLSDHKNYPDSICSHEDQKDPVGKRLSTVYAVLMDLNECSLEVTTSAPCESSFRTYTLDH